MSLDSQQLAAELPVVVPAAGSDSDSGMGSPVEEMATEMTNTEALQADSDEEITVSRRHGWRKALQDSDSEEGEEHGAQMAEALVLSASSGDEAEAAEEAGKREEKSGAAKSKRIARAPVDSDESGAEEEEEEPEKKEVKQKKEGKKREKSQRHKDKRERRSKALERVKKDRSEEVPLPRALNDSGCLLGDPDLFDAGLEEEEESLDAIRAAVKQKVKKHKEPFMDEEEEGGYEEDEPKPQRKERKAAKASKEAMKQLHSETQRLVRESSLGLPYHMPEPKSIDEFFRKRARPAGPAMALLKSTKYQETMILEATPAPLPPNPPPKEPRHETAAQQDPSLDLPCPAQVQNLPQPAATSSPQQEPHPRAPERDPEAPPPPEPEDTPGASERRRPNPDPPERRSRKTPGLRCRSRAERRFPPSPARRSPALRG